MDSIPVVIGLVLALIGIGTALGKVFVSSNRETLVTLQQAEINILKGRCDRLEADLSAQDRKCIEDLAELRGHLDSVTGAFARELATEVVKAVRETR